MLDLPKYQSLGEALRAALDRWPDEVCLIEANRDRENARSTYRQFKEAALGLASAMQRAGFRSGTRASIVMSNQSKWLITAYAIFFCGGVLVPLDYRLLDAEAQLDLLAHSKAEFLIVEDYLWAAMQKQSSFKDRSARVVLVTESTAKSNLAGAYKWEEFRDASEPQFVPRKRADAACIVYSSGTTGRPKGCVLTHDNYLEQCVSLTALYPFWPGVRYLSILPTNHAIDFMVGFIGPFTCGATVVHLRSLSPEYIINAFKTYKITYMALVPVLLENFKDGIETKIQEASPLKQKVLGALVSANAALTSGRPRLGLSRALLKPIHAAFGGELRALFVGGAKTPASLLQYFYSLGIPVRNGYGCTEACTAITLNKDEPALTYSVGKPLPGVTVKIKDPDAAGEGEVMVRSRTVMSHYLDDAEMTDKTIIDGWLMTGDVGKLHSNGHLELVGRKKNMIVTAEGRNIYPEDVEKKFDGLPVRRFCIFAENFIWEARTMENEQLVLALRLPEGAEITRALVDEIEERNRKLPHFKRIGGYLVWNKDFPLTGKREVNRAALAQEIAAASDREIVVRL
jgi:long-chain acyl-CoA synthetase